jgi:very-short-patch-repair endonuclease
MDSGRLRELLRPRVIELGNRYTHTGLTAVCEELGLPHLDPTGSKRERLSGSFDALGATELPQVAERLLAQHPPSALIRNEIQDVLWETTAAPRIPKRFRRETARAIAIEDIYLDGRRFMELLERVWVLDDDPMGFMTEVDSSLRGSIDRHIFRNPGDWSTEELFDELGALESSDRRFALFLEGLASADVRPDETAQRCFVDIVNGALRPCGVEMRETDTEGGYPVFTVVASHAAVTGRPKNLIFASPVKPDLRFRDALNNDIEIVTNSDKVLVYDLPLGVDGLRWRDLQSWWAEREEVLDDDDAKRSLYLRLRGSLPKTSPPQALLFDAFYRGFGDAVPDLPALLPEVWLHWDAKTVQERGRLALLRFRMDFLLLLPHGIRVVIEVDGKHHYSGSDGVADGARYSAMAAADRELKLAGYQVFRFGAEELRGDAARGVVKAFFDRLFKRYGVEVPGKHEKSAARNGRP